MNIDDDLHAALTVLEGQAPDRDRVLASVPIQARARRRRKTMLVTGGVGAAAAAATFAGLTVPAVMAPTAGAPARHVATPPRVAQPGQPAKPDAAALRSALLTAYARADGSIAYSHLVYSSDVYSSDSQAVSDIQVWSYPARPKPGQLVRVRMLIKGFRDTEVSFVMPAAGSAMVTGEAIDVGYGNRTWSQARDVTLAFAGALADPTWEIRPNLTSGKYDVVRRVELGSRTLIEISVRDSHAPGSVSTVWVDSRTHLPVTSPISLPAKHGSPAGKVYFFNSTAYFGYLPPTSENLAALRPAVPAGFTRTAIGALPKDLGGNPTTPASS